MSRSIRGASVVLVSACCLVLCLGLAAHRAVAQPLPNYASVVVWHDESTTRLYPFDTLIFTGKPVTYGPLSGCTEAVLPIQDAVLITDGGAGSGLISVRIDSDDAVPPGTRVSNFVPGITCTSESSIYKKYTGFAE